MRWTSAIALAAVAEAAPQFGGSAYTMLRFGCAQIDIERLDPLVDPGQVPSGHIHQIVGGNGFNATMTSGDVSGTASCTSCEFADDFSNYWTANMYFRGRNGSFKRVPQAGSAYQFNDRFSTQTGGGVLVYYVSMAPGSITAFKPGFRMLVGDPLKRTLDTSLKYQSCFRCYTGPNYGGDVSAPCQGSPTLDTQHLPTGTCYGIRSNILFPTCWDGKSLDSPNHQDHIAYPSSGPATFLNLGGTCPSTHPVRIPQLMLEVVWNTTTFNDKSDWPQDGKSPFYLSTGDNTGYGQHADYVFGWKGNALQTAMDASGCMGASCKNLATQTIDVATKCGVKQMAQEDVNGWLDTLPGIDPTQIDPM